MIHDSIIKNSNTKPIGMEKWQNILNTILEMENVWPHFKCNPCNDNVKSTTYVQIHLNFYGPYVAKLGKKQKYSQCRLCDEDQLQQEHKIIKCQTTNLFNKFKMLL